MYRYGRGYGHRTLDSDLLREPFVLPRGIITLSFCTVAPRTSIYSENDGASNLPRRYYISPVHWSKFSRGNVCNGNERLTSSELLCIFSSFKSREVLSQGYFSRSLCWVPYERREIKRSFLGPSWNRNLSSDESENDGCHKSFNFLGKVYVSLRKRFYRCKRGGLIERKRGFYSKKSVLYYYRKRTDFFRT